MFSMPHNTFYFLSWVYNFYWVTFFFSKWIFGILKSRRLVNIFSLLVFTFKRYSYCKERMKKKYYEKEPSLFSLNAHQKFYFSWFFLRILFYFFFYFSSHIWNKNFLLSLLCVSFIAIWILLQSYWFLLFRL